MPKKNKMNPKGMGISSMLGSDFSSHANLPTEAIIKEFPMQEYVNYDLRKEATYDQINRTTNSMVNKARKQKP